MKRPIIMEGQHSFEFTFIIETSHLQVKGEDILVQSANMMNHINQYRRSFF